MDENTSQGGFETTTATEEGIQASDVLQQAEGIETMAESEPTPETLVKAEETETEEVPKVDESKPEEDKKFAARFAALSRKEKALREREAQVNERMQQLEAQIAKMQESKEPEPEPEMPWDQMLEEDPLNALKKKGLSYEELTRIVMNDGKLTPEMQLRLIEQKMDRKYSAEIQKLREEREQEKESAEKERHENTIKNFKAHIGETISGNSEKYELLGIEGDEGVNLVYNVIDEHYKESGTVMDVEEAAQLTEDYLLEEAKKRVGLSKIKKLLGASETSQEPKPEEVKSQESVTLSNSQAQTSTTGERFLSDEESKREAAKLIRWYED